MNIDFHFAKRAIYGEEQVCGDTGITVCDGETLFLALIDALGHGPVAAGIADQARSYLLGHHGPTTDLRGIMQGLHENLKNTRGAVGAACRLDLISGIISYTGIGNITLRIFGRNPQTLRTQEGILGYMIPTPVQNEIKLSTGDIMVIHSDGIRGHFDQHDYPDLLLGQAADICAGFINHLGKSNDDVSCIVLRYDT